MKTPEDYGIENYTWNNGKLDVNGDVYLWDRGLTGLPFEFGVVTGNFRCNDNNLTSLSGAPAVVGEDFSCAINRLTTLQGAPRKVGGWFNCNNNRLTSLQGAPKEIGGNFECYNNRLTTLAGMPYTRDDGQLFYIDCRGNSLSVSDLLATIDDPVVAYAYMKKYKTPRIPNKIRRAWENHLSNMDKLEVIQEYAKYGLRIPNKHRKADDSEPDNSELLDILEDLAK